MESSEEVLMKRIRGNDGEVRFLHPIFELIQSQARLLPSRYRPGAFVIRQLPNVQTPIEDLHALLGFSFFAPLESTSHTLT
jgi:hypothetical protein